MKVDVATEARRLVMAMCASMVVCLLLVAVESALGIGLGWRLVLNQIPASYTVHAVMCWSRSGGEA